MQDLFPSDKTACFSVDIIFARRRCRPARRANDESVGHDEHGDYWREKTRCRHRRPHRCVRPLRAHLYFLLLLLLPTATTTAIDNTIYSGILLGGRGSTDGPRIRRDRKTDPSALIFCPASTAMIFNPSHTFVGNGSWGHRYLQMFLPHCINIHY